MIEIDGSYGEGGGQILRTAVALSAITKEDIEINNIRHNRPEKGLKAQHLKSIETVAMICDAQVKGLFPGSTRICFSPSEIRKLEAHIQIGTAGSIPLLMQSIMPIAAYSPESTKLRVTGGTDVAWSPSIDYLKELTLNALSKMGYKANIRLLERGYYPKGGGVAEIEIKPSTLKGFDFKTVKNGVHGVSHCSNLPEHVAKRQADSAQKLLEENETDVHIDIETENYNSTGSGITLWSGLVGSVNTGKKGMPAEKVGSQAALFLLDEIKSRAAVDIHLADQLIPYMGLAGSGSFTTRYLTPHCLTNIHVTEQLLDVHFIINKNNGLVEISVE